MYRQIDGVVLTQVGGENILVATRSAWERCPSIKTLSPLFAAYWQGISLGMSEEEIVQELLQKTSIKEEALRRRLTAFLQEMKEAGYLYEEGSV